MTLKRTLRSCYVSIIAVTCSSLAGCDENWAKRFDRGATIPDARLELKLSEPQSVIELLPRYEKAANIGGFPYMWGGAVTAEEVEASSRRNFSWVKAEDSASVFQYRVTFFTPRQEEQSTKKITFVFSNDSTDLFTKDEWLMFYQWKDEYLPEVFPGATISISRHPAVFTSHEDIMEFERDMGIEVPEEYRSSSGVSE